MNKEKSCKIILDITITHVLLLCQHRILIIYYLKIKISLYISINNFMVYFIYDFLNSDII